MGINPYHELNRDIPIANGRYRMLLHHLQFYTKYGSAIPFHNTPNFGLFCAASQVQLDAQADTAVDMLNVFARLPLRPQATKRERELLLCHVKLLFWRSTAAITLTARRPEIKGGVLLMPCDIGWVDRIAAEDPAAFETIKAVLADAAPWLRGVTEDSLLGEARAGAEAFRLENLAGQLAKKPVFCISGDMDIYTPPRHNCLPLEQAVRKAGGTQFRRLSLYTDHCFSDYRLTVAQRISDYLSELLSPP